MRRTVLLLGLVLAGCQNHEASVGSEKSIESTVRLPGWRLKPGDVLNLRLQSHVNWPKFNVRSCLPRGGDWVEGEAILTVLVIETGDVAFCELRVPAVRQGGEGSGLIRFDSVHEEVWREPMMMAFLSAKGGLEVIIDERLFPDAVVDFVHALELALPPITPGAGTPDDTCLEKATAASLQWTAAATPGIQRVVLTHQFRSDGKPGSLVDDVTGPKEIQSALLDGDSDMFRNWGNRLRPGRVCSPSFNSLVVESSGRYAFISTSGFMEAGTRSVLTNWSHGDDFCWRSRQELSIKVSLQTQGSPANQGTCSSDPK